MAPNSTDRRMPEFDLSMQGEAPHAYDPETHPEFFSGIIGKRVMAFIIDVVVITVLWLLGSVVIFILGLLSFGLIWLLWGAALILLVLGYEALTLGGPYSATYGMRIMGIEMRTWYGDRPGVLQAAAHSLLFYFSVTLTTFLILLAPLFNNRKRCVHDFLCGTVFINTEALGQHQAA